MGLSMLVNLGLRWRAEPNLSSGKSLDQEHRAAAKRTGPERNHWAAGSRVGWRRMGRSRCCSGEQLFAKRNQGAAEDFVENPNREEEILLWGVYPMRFQAWRTLKK